MYPRETAANVYQDTFFKIFIAALFVKGNKIETIKIFIKSEMYK